MQAFRAQGTRGQIGIVVNLEPKYPASDSAADLAAVQRADAYMNRFFLDPVLLGSYPDELRDIFAGVWIAVTAADLALIRERLDFLGINYYKRSVTCDDASDTPVRAGSVAQPQHVHTSAPIRSLISQGTFTYRLNGAVFVRKPLPQTVPFSEQGNLSVT